MKSLKFSIAALALLVTLGVRAQTPQEVADKYNEAVELIKAKNFGDAIPIVEEVITMAQAAGMEGEEVTNSAQQLLPQILFQYGGSLIQANKPAEALPNFEKAVDTAEKYGNTNILVRAKEWVGRTYLAMGAAAFNAQNYTEAAEIFAKGYEVAPNNTDLATNLAVSYAEMNDYDKAYETFRAIIALEQHGDKYKDAVANARGKMAYYMMLNANDLAKSKASDAIEVLKEAVTVAPDNQQAYMLLIQIGNNSKNFDTVIEYADKAAELQQDPDMKSTAYFLLAAAYENKGNKAKAIENYRKVTSGPHAADAKSQITALQAAA